jgi:hypothetical protein
MSQITGFDRSRVVIDMETGEARYTSWCVYCGKSCDNCTFEECHRWESRHVIECEYRNQYARIRTAAA